MQVPVLFDEHLVERQPRGRDVAAPRGIESTKSVSDVYAPVSGSVVAVNEALVSNPELLNSDPYGDGWLCEIEMSNAAEVETLLDASGYETLTAG